MQFIVKLTNCCNLRCKYCSETAADDGMFLSPAVLYKLIDELPDVLSKLKEKKIDFLWHGGEPMLYNKNDLSKIMDYALETLAPQYEVNFIMQSNITLLDEEWLNIIKKYKIGVGVSLDGYRELHDANRVDADGKGTFATVIKNLHILQQNDFHPGMLMVLNTEDKIDVDLLFDFIKKEKLHPKIHPVIPVGRAMGMNNVLEIETNYLNILERLWERNMDEECPIDINPLSEIIMAIIGQHELSECSYSGTCGIGMICLYYDGNIGFCGRHDEKFSLRYGNLNEHTLWELYTSANAEKIRQRQEYLQSNDCKDCAEWKYCRGGCAFEALNAYNTTEHKFPGCRWRKKLMQYARTKGLNLFKKYLVRERRVYQQILSEEKTLLEELKNSAIY